MWKMAHFTTQGVSREVVGVFASVFATIDRQSREQKSDCVPDASNSPDVGSCRSTWFSVGPHRRPEDRDGELGSPTDKKNEKTNFVYGFERA